MEGNTRARQKTATDSGVRTASGIYRDVLAKHFPDLHLDIVQGTQGAKGLPSENGLSDYDGLVIGGSGLRCADTTSAVTAQIELLRQFAKLGRPILGSCWGLQIAVIAAGGTVRPSPNGREIVIARKIKLTQEGRDHVFYDGKRSVFDAPCIHYDEVESLPAGSTLLCSNAHSEVQGALVPLEKSVVWGVQYHPEFDLGHLAGLVRVYREAVIRDGFFADTQAQATYVDTLGRLASRPNDKSLAWQLGIDADLLDDDIRAAEIVNWVRAQILAT
jgi:GMP synthase (glutamine-hydrolysing)